MKRLLRLPAAQWLLANAVVAYVRLLMATMRWKVEDSGLIEEAVSSAGGAMALFWHGRISQAMACLPLLGDKPRKVMISLSRDGDFISMAAERLGVPVIRGSTGKGAASKGGGEAFREAVRFLAAGGALLLTPDGPRGPREVLSSGAPRLAAAAGAPVFAVGFAAHPSFSLHSWDRARAPLPFARGRIVVTGPLRAPRDLAAGALEAVRLEWQQRLREAQARAEALAAHPALPGGLGAYRLATNVLSPLVPAVLALRAAFGKEDTPRLAERLGWASHVRPAGRIAWLHGASVGEALSLLPLIEAMAARGDVALLVTSGTRTAAEVVAARLPAGAIHQYAPVDTPAAAERFLAYWRPELAVFAESELWPNILLRAKAGGATLTLVSARMSPASFARWTAAPEAARTLLGAFDLVLARDEDQAGRLLDLGARVDGIADLKFAAEPLPADAEELARLRAALGDRPLVLAASTHAGEEAMIFRAWKAGVADLAPRPLLAVVPRHPSRGGEVVRDARRAGLRTALRSQGAFAEGLDVLVADTLGELGLFYRICVLAFIGGSLVPRGGGHNPLEPARLGCPFVCGPYAANWPVYARLEELRATRRVRADELPAVFAQAVNEPGAFAAMAERASRFVGEGDLQAREGVGRVVELLGR